MPGENAVDDIQIHAMDVPAYSHITINVGVAVYKVFHKTPIGFLLGYHILVVIAFG